VEVVSLLPHTIEVIFKRDAPDLSPGSYTTAEPVVLERRRAKLVSAEKTGRRPGFNGEDDLDKSLWSSGSFTPEERQAPQLIAGYDSTQGAVEELPVLPDTFEIMG
jgi:hypothetical protein